MKGNEKIPTVSSSTITRHSVHIFKEQKEKIKKELKEAEYLCETIDLWTDKHRKRSVVGITMHNVSKISFK